MIVRLLPADLAAALSPVANQPDAEAFTRQLTHTHYENFSAVSRLLPRELRQDFCNVYAFCRTADDLGDELGDPALASAWLARFGGLTRDCFAGHADVALFVALRSTIQRHAMPIKPFLDLIDAFEQDQTVTRYETTDQLHDYCRRSADPVGRLVLWMCGCRDEERQRLSDFTCTALQLANFLQDVRRDLLDRDRIYLPGDIMRQHGVTDASIRQDVAAGRAGTAFRSMMQAEVQRVTAMFDAGEPLLAMLPLTVRGQVSLFGQGGRAILQAIADQGFDPLASRPSLSRWQKGRLIGGAMWAVAQRKLFGGDAGRASA